MIFFCSTKKIKPVNYLDQIQKPVDDPKLKPMYCKDKIYRGNTIVSYKESTVSTIDINSISTIK